MMYVQIPLGPLQTNCYVLANEEKECVIFDPGAQSEKLIRFIEEKQYKPLAILLTHAHFDHIGAVDDVKEKYSLPVYIHQDEQHWLTDPALNGSQFFGIGSISAGEATDIISEEGILNIGSFELYVFETPGHSPGSVSYYAAKEGLVFSGDALFAGSIGRTDLPGGNHRQLLASIDKKLMQLPEETVVLSGHGSETTVGQEMDQNPFLNGF
ncbi:MBL fold metallo-hydrolase [Metabacillus iocasae]|uniref:Glyoxylase-like metal-dependent hydrolase (Beta-lactamase superfamily II) n=1 Tax=Priestia iocasae TaxID=2291674 RepID=A0ABS2QQ59_9BACI|nr:MBL fold metallo-hydrolase [Metabacillus iocasae]MBM7701540.1 glyoxylase-like metal-dependent hydrolase (beta-lactamase superfamily II) [Metabacillus iocasae]